MTSRVLHQSRRSALSPLVGESWREGCERDPSHLSASTPTPSPSPQGGGELTEFNP
jgi:hypothetical protein